MRIADEYEVFCDGVSVWDVVAIYSGVGGLSDYISVKWVWSGRVKD